MQDLGLTRREAELAASLAAAAGGLAAGAGAVAISAVLLLAIAFLAGTLPAARAPRRSQACAATMRMRSGGRPTRSIASR